MDGETDYDRDKYDEDQYKQDDDFEDAQEEHWDDDLLKNPETRNTGDFQFERPKLTFRQTKEFRERRDQRNRTDLGILQQFKEILGTPIKRENGFFPFENVRFEKSNQKTYVLYRDTDIYKGDENGDAFVSIKAIWNKDLKENKNRVDKAVARDLEDSGKKREVDKRRKILFNTIKKLQQEFRAQFEQAKARYERHFFTI